VAELVDVPSCNLSISCSQAAPSRIAVIVTTL